MTWGDYIISGAVIVLVLIAAWRGGQVNPVGTGKLSRRLNALEIKVGEHGQRLDGIERGVGALAEALGETNRGIQAMRVEVAGDRGLTERTWGAVDRLQHFFIEEAFERRRDR